MKLIASVFGADEGHLRQAELCLCRDFGCIDYRSDLLPFNHTDYYADEFGASLLRVILAFERLIDPAILPAIKRRTNSLERACSAARRWVNIDPGYVSLGKLVLATTKDHAHRVYLSEGIYAEVTLQYRGGTFVPWPWTYPDYASADYVAIFNSIRASYHRQIRSTVRPPRDGLVDGARSFGHDDESGGLA